MLQSGRRETKETCIEVLLETEGSGRINVDTGIKLLDQMLSLMGQAALFDLTVRAKGDKETGDHHTIEDTGLTLGGTISRAIKRGTGSSIVPLGQSLALAAVSFGEPGYRGDFSFQSESTAGMSLENFGHFLRALAYSGVFTLIIRAEEGDDQSKIMAMSIALGRAIRDALRDSEK